MTSFNFNEMGITLDNVKDFEAAFAEYKKQLRENVKAESDNRKASAIDAANALIADGTLYKGASVVVMYNKHEVVGTLKTVPTVSSKNLSVLSDEFENKDKFSYIPKSCFVRAV